MVETDLFNGVACCCIGKEVELATITNILDLSVTSRHHNIECYNLKLSNKYYATTIHLYDVSNINSEEDRSDAFSNSYAIVLIGDARYITDELLDSKVEELSDIGGEPRLLLCLSLSEEDPCYRGLQDWCIRNNYELLLSDETDIKDQLIGSLSAYRWVEVSHDASVSHDGKNASANGKVTDTDGTNFKEDIMKKMMDFDSLLHKLSAYRNQPEMRGRADDKNIVEIAELLSGLLGDENDHFLEDESD